MECYDSVWYQSILSFVIVTFRWLLFIFVYLGMFYFEESSWQLSVHLISTVYGLENLSGYFSLKLNNGIPHFKITNLF